MLLEGWSKVQFIKTTLYFSIYDAYCNLVRRILNFGGDAFILVVLCFTVSDKSWHRLALWIAQIYDTVSSSSAATAVDITPGRVGELLWQLRSAVIVPLVRLSIAVCLIMSAIVLIEKLGMGIISLYAKVFRRRPHRVYKCDPIAADEEMGSCAHPMVLVQIPMYNEKEVCCCCCFFFSFT